MSEMRNLTECLISAVFFFLLSIMFYQCLVRVPLGGKVC